MNLDINIEDRLDYILRKVSKMCGCTFTGWYVDGAAEGQIGDIEKVFDGEYIYKNTIEYYGIKETKDCNFGAIIKDDVYDLSERMPKRWLFEDFEEELKRGVELYRVRLKNKKEAAVKRRLANKQRKEKLLQSARNKLTIEEQKAVGIFRK